MLKVDCSSLWLVFRNTKKAKQNFLFLFFWSETYQCVFLEFTISRGIILCLLLFLATGNFATSNKRQPPCCTAQYRYCKFWSCFPLIWFAIWESYSADLYFLSQKFCFTHLWGFQHFILSGLSGIAHERKGSKAYKEGSGLKCLLNTVSFFFILFFFSFYKHLPDWRISMKP